jgi:hypothetical protein
MEAHREPTLEERVYWLEGAVSRLAWTLSQLVGALCGSIGGWMVSSHFQSAMLSLLAFFAAYIIGFVTAKRHFFKWAPVVKFARTEDRNE